MTTAAFALRIDGIIGYDPLFVPIRDVATDWRMNYAVQQAGKISNSDADVSLNLVTWEMVRDLSDGAFKKFRDSSQTRYYVPEPAGTGSAWSDNIVQSLLWTLRPNEPLMCGAPVTSKVGNYAFREIVEYEDKPYAIDSKNNKVYSYNGSAWVDDNAGLNGSYPTGILSAGTTLYVGTDSGIARKKVAGAWSNFTDASGANTSAQQFVLVGSQGTGYTLWYSSANLLTERRTNGRVFSVGDDARRIERLLWFDNYIIATKRDGCYRCYPDSKLIRPIMNSNNKSSLNGRTLVFFQNRAYFNMDGDFWSWDGQTRFRETPAEFEGSGGTPFYKGEVIGASTDGAHLYIIYRVLSGSQYQYWLMSKSSSVPREGWHPLLLVTTTTAPGTGLPSGAYEPSGIFYENNRLHYAMGNDTTSPGRALTGYLNTNGDTPLQTGTDYYVKDVAVHLGWYDGGKRAIQKFLKELRYTLRDQSGTGYAQFYYKKWNDATWTPIGATGQGNADNVTVPIPQEAGAQIGITANNYFAIKVELKNASSTPTSAWWLSDLYLLGLPCYTPTRQGSFAVYLSENMDDVRPFDAARIKAGLLAAISQAQPVKLTLPDGTSVYAKLSAGSQQQIEKYNKDENNEARSVTKEVMVLEWREVA